MAGKRGVFGAAFKAKVAPAAAKGDRGGKRTRLSPKIPCNIYAKAFDRSR